jgi:serine/threonine protein kinase
MSAVTIGDYQLTTPLTNNNAGMCQWAFARKNAHDYFIKQLLEPKYPTASAEEKLSPTIVSAMKVKADAFYSARTRFYNKLRECRTGNVVVVEEFFREEESYYVVTDKMDGPFLSIAQIAKLSDEKKRTLLKSILYSIRPIHDRGIVHSDLKPENILVKPTKEGFCTAKLIDFDDGFFEYDIPDEIVGDQRYFSPEAVLRNDEEDVPVTVKSDIFALGLLFHQYWCGDFPLFGQKENGYACIALLNDVQLKFNPSIPEDIRMLIEKMLEKDESKRPSAREAFEMITHTSSCSGGFRTPTINDL